MTTMAFPHSSQFSTSKLSQFPHPRQLEAARCSERACDQGRATVTKIEDDTHFLGDFHQWGYPKMVGLYWTILK
jgi:hypothetical protein